MDVSTRFALETHVGPYECWPTTSRLIVDGTMVDTRIDGFVIDGQYETDVGSLLLTSYACPYEEASTFTLLDARQRVLATQRLGAPYASMLLHGHWPIDARTLVLHFNDERFHSLHVRGRGRWPWQRARIELRERRDWRDDPRIREAQQRLAAQLASIRTALDES